LRASDAIRGPQLANAGRLECLFTDSYTGAGSLLHPLFAGIPESWLRGPVKRLAQRHASCQGSGVGVQTGLELPIPGRWNGVRLRRYFSNSTTGSPSSSQGIIVLHQRMRSNGFCGTAVTLFRNRKAAGQYCILEQMIAPVAEQVAQVRAQEKRWPDWACFGVQ